MMGAHVMAPHRRRIHPGRLIAWLAALALAVISAAPVVWIALTSFKTFVETQASPPIWIPDFTHVQAYVEEFFGLRGRAGGAVDSLLHSLLVATGAMLVTMAVAIPAAYGLARYRIARRDGIQFWIISSRMMPVIAAIVPLSTMLLWLGLNDTFHGLILAYLAVNLSFAVWLMSDFFASIPREVEDAARIDGLSRWAALGRITIPLARPSIAVIAMFTWIFSWNELLMAMVLTTGKTQTLPVYMATFNAGNTLTKYPNLAAAGVVQVIPAILIVLFLQRHIVSGLSMGAVAGE
jgi:ABC-type glycerol-3-phosphate transport system permease component